MKEKILVVDDEEGIRDLIETHLQRAGYAISVAVDAEDALRRYPLRGEIAVLVSDLRLPGKQGFELIQELSHRNPCMRSIVITGVTGEDRRIEALRAIRAGVSDYLEKPLKMPDLTAAVERGLKEHRDLLLKYDTVSRYEARLHQIEGRLEDKIWFLSNSPTMLEVNNCIASLRHEAASGETKEPTVLLLGEPGSGQDGIARMIHLGSRRAHCPWAVLNCGQFSASQLEKELFGEEKLGSDGEIAVTYGLFELTHGGTAFLEEIGSLDAHLQERLIQVFQSKTYFRVGGKTELDFDVRMIASAGVGFDYRVQQGKFHEGLYKLLSRVSLEVPSLHERKDDIVPMATHFARQSFDFVGKKFEGFTPGAEKALCDYRWPGSMRELYYLIVRVAAAWEGVGPVTPQTLSVPGVSVGAESALPLVSASASSSSSNGTGATILQLVPTGGGRTAPSSVPTMQMPDVNVAEVGYTELKRRWSDSFEKDYLSAALDRNSGNVSAAARECKLDRSNFLRLLRRHGLRAEQYRKLAAA